MKNKKNPTAIEAHTIPVPSWVFVILSPIVALFFSFAVVGVIIALLGENPFHALSTMIKGIVGSIEGISYSLYYATNFIFTGLCVCVAFHGGLFNIGGEGQVHFGGLCLALILIWFDSSVSPWLLIPLACLASMIGGAACAFIPGWLQAWRGSHIVITTIMFNFIASGIILWIVLTFLLPSGQSAPESREFASGITLPFFHDLFGFVVSDHYYSPLNVMLLVAILTAWLVWFILFRSRWGYELRVFGQSHQAARYAGIKNKKLIISAMCLSGALAGMMAINETLVVNHKLIVGFPSGFGFVGIAVSLMGRNHPVGIVLAALLFGAIYQGGNEISFEIPSLSRDMVVVMQGTIILFVGALANFFNPLLKTSYRRYILMLPGTKRLT